MSSGTRTPFITPCPASKTINVVTDIQEVFSAGLFDAFGRMRVSNPYTLFEFTSIQGDGQSNQGPNIIDQQITGSGTATWNPGSYVAMDVSGVGLVIRQTHEAIVYQPGKSKLVIMTGVLYHNTIGTTGLTARIGPFDASMGYFIEASGATIGIVERSDSVDSRIEQSAWNIDVLNGLGACPAQVDFTKAQIFVFDFEWLGVGRVRCGVVIGGVIYYYHEFTHTNTLVAPYIRSAKLPLRYEIRGTATTKNQMRMMCGTVISEGGFSPLSRSFWYPTAAFPYVKLTMPNNQNWIPILSFELRSDYPSRLGTMKVRSVDIINDNTPKGGAWQLVLGGGPSSDLSYNNYDASSSIVKYATNTINSITWSNGKVIASGFYSGRTSMNQFVSTDELIQAPAICFNSLTNTSDRVTLIVSNLTAGASDSVYASVQWVELI